jgi:hypothetical protein
MRYRITQFWRSFRAKAFPIQLKEEIGAILNGDQLKLFEQMPVEDQEHSYRVMKSLRDSGEVNRDLLVAALLHDVGKIKAPVTVWERILVVLVEAGMPDKADRYSEGSPHGWRRAFVVQARHPIWSADLAREAGCCALTVSLIQRHHECIMAEQESEEAQLLRALQRADNSS